MPDDATTPSPVTVGHLIATVSRIEHWLATMRVALEAMPADTPIDLPSDTTTFEDLQALQPSSSRC
jgi:hypothetical protein